ncbi:MAG: hypothetical protein JXA99_15910 [Candidatus Lokiarchaeota archaeon]|nr:hypothetical protein [Candidatus Lokiarchaeota archaeon]
MTMQKRMYKLRLILLLLIIGITSLAFISNTILSNHKIDNIENIVELRQNILERTNYTVISDGYGGVYWNRRSCDTPSMAIDNEGKLHAVWDCYMEEQWGTDYEILYASSIDGTSWSNVTVISDDYTLWNTGSSTDPEIVADHNNNLHVIWQDTTHGPWGDYYEIMYANYTQGIGWSNATVISDGYEGYYWHNSIAYGKDITVDSNNNLHVVWGDETEGIWGDDGEIMYVNYIQGIGWSNITIISDDETHWNNGTSNDPTIAIDSFDKIHVMWNDYTHGSWGESGVVMYASSSNGSSWSDVTVMYDLGLEYTTGAAPDMCADEKGNIHIALMGGYGFDSNLYYISHNEIEGWSAPVCFTEDSSDWITSSSDFQPSISVDNFGTVHLAFTYATFESAYDNDLEIRYRAYNEDFGLTPSQLLSDGFGGDYYSSSRDSYPSLVTDTDGKAHVIWVGRRPGVWMEAYEYEIFYCNIVDLPNLDSPEDITYEQDMTGYSITWNPSGINPNNYTIKEGDTIVQTGNWNNSSPINVPIDGLSYGSYSYTINITNMPGKYNTDTITVNVLEPLNPEISEPLDLTFEEGETDRSIFWTATDLNANNYTISNGTDIIKIGNWISGILIEFELGAIEEGSYNYDIIVYDKGGHSSSDSVSVNVLEPHDPTISHPDDFSYTQYTKGNTISWTASDQFPDNYRLTRNGSNIESHSWISDVPIIINIDNLPDGLYLYQIYVYDKAGHSTMDSVYVLVNASDKPNTISLGFLPIGITLVGIIVFIAYMKRKIKI